MIEKTNKADFWQEHQHKWLDSGLSQKIYCQQNRLSHHTFKYWRARQKVIADVGVDSFVPVYVKDLASAVSGTFIEIHCGSTKVLLPHSVPAQYVGEIVRSLA
jgi:hypothetical protein